MSYPPPPNQQYPQYQYPPQQPGQPPAQGQPQELPLGAPPYPQAPYPTAGTPQPGAPYPGTPQPGQYQAPPPGQQPYGYPAQPQYQYPPQQPGQYAPPPQQPGQPPAAGQYPPQQPGQPPVAGQYPPPPAGYPQQPGYPPQGYPPQQPGYPPQPGQPGPDSRAGQAPPQQPGYPPQQGYPPQPGYPPQGYPPQQPGYPPQGQPGYPPQQPGYPPQPGYPAQAVPGQAPYQQAPYAHPQGYTPQAAPVTPSATYTQDIQDIIKAAKGFGCDERAIIKILGTRNAPTIDAIRNNFKKHNKKTDLITLLEKELSGDLETACIATAYGREESEAFWARKAVAGAGTDETLLTEALLGKKNTEIETIKRVYRARFLANLEDDLKGDLSGKTEKLFLMAIEGQKQEDWIQPDQNSINKDVNLLHMATEARLGTDEIQVFSIFTRSNDAHLRAVAQVYEQTHRKSLAKVIKKEFSGHQEDALLYILEGAIDKAGRDAKLLEDAMAGFGTRDTLLIARIVRIHWDAYHLEAVKKAYYNRYHRDLISRVKGETSGNYEKMLVTLLGG